MSSLSPGKTMDLHYRIKRDSCVGVITPQRMCSGCRRRRSHTQFIGAAIKCNQCVRRTPKTLPIGGHP